MKIKYIILFLSFISFAITQGQNNGRTYQEIGIMGGPVFFQGDFGERFNVNNIIKNVGASASFAYYVSLNEDRNNLGQRVKIRFDITGMTVNLQHFGPSASSDTNFGRKLRGMRSDVKIGTLGAQMEYYPWKTDDYSRAALSPYIAVGGQINSFSADAYSYLGNIGNIEVVPEKYVTGFRDDSGIAFSTTASLGVRLRLTTFNYLLLEGQLKYYFSDWIEGMNPDRRIYTENRNNDFSGTLNIGYIYYFH